MEPEGGIDVRRSVRIPNWTTLALIGALIVLVLLIAYFARGRNPDQDKLTQNQVAQSEPQAKAPPVEKLCAGNHTYDLIKRELFRRAAQLRGSDQAAFDELSAYAVVRMDNPVMESQNSATGAVNCSGTLSLDLPPGVAIVGGHHNLTSDVDYTIEQAADGSGDVILLRNADSIIAPLATLARVGQPAATTPKPSLTTPIGSNSAARQRPLPTAPQLTPPSPPAQQHAKPPAGPAPAPTAAHPSFDCARARRRGELAVCSSAGLAALDRNMANQYAQAVAKATPEQRALLRRTGRRFIVYRDRCPNRSCIGSAYLGRMREIRDIMEGHWHPPR